MLLPAAAIVLAVPAPAKTPVLHVSGWVRPTVPSQNASAAYLSIHNAGPGADRLLSVSTPVASSASVHSTSTTGGIMRMRPAGPVPIAGGQQITMRPGGLHVMLTGLKAPLRAGGTVALTLRFERAGNVKVALPIRMSAPGDEHGQHRH